MVCRKRHGYLILIRHTKIFNAPNYYSYQIFNVEVKCFINSFSPEKIENYNFEIPTIPQTLNINNKRTASAKSINRDVFWKAYQILFKTGFVESNILSAFEVLLFEARSVLWPALRFAGRERFKRSCLGFS